MKELTSLTRFLFLFVVATGISFLSFGQQSREEIDDQYKWDLSGLYSSNEEWQQALDLLSSRMNQIEKFKGNVTTSARNLLEVLNLNSEISKEFLKASSYASLYADLDTRDMTYNGMNQQLEQLSASYNAKAAFLQPEILESDWFEIESFLDSEPELEQYRMTLKNMFRTKAHTLSEEEERIMSLSTLISGVPYSTYNTFSNAEMPKPEVTLSTGETVSLGTSEYNKYRASSNRKDRELVFNAFWNNHSKYVGTIGEMLYGNVKADVFKSQARQYDSSLEASLYPNNIPVEVYHSLVDNVNKNLPAFHRYLEIKKRMLGVDTLKYSDLYAPVVKDVELTYTYEEAKKLLIKALNPLGKEYISVVEKALNERWIDVYPTPGKRSGAYSSGDVYDGHPFILMNYNDLYDDVSTLAHEMGHTMQSYFSNKTQPYPTSDYTTFVAEVASTFNEVLLFNYMINEVEDDDIKLSFLMNWLDNFKGTLFRQTQFAEFELKIHEVAEDGNPLTGETFSAIYDDIVKRYYGHDEKVCFVDDYIANEWAFVPHFYYNFYVYQYSTAFTASISLAEKVMSGDKDALAKYMNFLSAGSSEYPIDLLKNAGVDMTTSDPFDKTIESMNKVMDEIEEILDRKNK